MNGPIGLMHKAGEEIAPEFLERILSPYRLHCRYLRSARVDFEGEPDWQSMVMRGEFGIDASCYIDDTGHFNAVEFNICYNQLAYVHLGVCIRDGLMPALDDYDEARFHARQLANFLIANIDSSYYAQLNPRRFFGEVRVVSARKGPKFSILKTTCRFHDGVTGRSEGEVKLVVLRP